MTDQSRDWPFDPDGENGSDGLRRFDMAVLSRFEPKTAFPMDRAEFLERHGDKPVRVNYRTVKPVAELLDGIEVETFESKTAFHRAVGEAIRDRSDWEFTVETG
ncbi:MAG: DUF5785 family protein [Halodesulfurarchaeum sp.]